VDSFILAKIAVPTNVIGGIVLRTASRCTPRPDVVPGVPLGLYGSQYPGGKAINPLRLPHRPPGSRAFRWLAGKTFSAPIPNIIYITNPEVLEKLERAMKEFYRAKAAFLESPEVYQARAARDEYRKTTEDIEAKAGCSIDTVKVGLPKPPNVVNRVEGPD
jgi:hypothetical protein